MNKTTLMAIMSKAATDWNYRQQLLQSPRSVLQQEGFKVPADKKIVILENTDDVFYVVLPPAVGKNAAATSPFTWTIENDIVRLNGRLDASAVEQIRDGILNLTGNITLDMQRLDYISSAGIGLLLSVFKKARAAGHSVRLTNLRPEVRNIFIISGVADLFQTC